MFAVQTSRRAGYLRNAVVEDSGCFAVRGGLLDVWPAASEFPVRVELLGDTIASLKHFDPESQRTQDSIEHVWLPVASELLAMTVTPPFAGDAAACSARSPGR